MSVITLNSHKVVWQSLLYNSRDLFLSTGINLNPIIDIKNNAWVTVNNDFWVTSEAICQ